MKPPLNFISEVHLKLQTTLEDKSQREKLIPFILPDMVQVKYIKEFILTLKIPPSIQT